MAGVPVQLLAASFSALLAAVVLERGGSTMTRKTALPFGPFLVLLTTLALQVWRLIG